MTAPTISRRLALLLRPMIWLVAIPLVHGVLPWAISLVGSRHGWGGGHPSSWNLLGAIPLVVGVTGLVWVVATGFAQSRDLPERVALDWSPKLLIVRGPYALSRNP